jgi:cysteine-rich repeat protein
MKTRNILIALNTMLASSCYGALGMFDFGAGTSTTSTDPSSSASDEPTSSMPSASAEPATSTTTSGGSFDTTTPPFDLPPDPYDGCEKPPENAPQEDLCPPEKLTPGNDNPECDADCTVVTCGDLHINEEAGEQCESGDTCDDHCQYKCGNGHLDDSPLEYCDDGNTINDDACSSACTKNGLLVFVSSGRYTGNFEAKQVDFPADVKDVEEYGIGDADMICRSLAIGAAANSGLPWRIPPATDHNHGFGAWLSHSVYQPVNDPGEMQQALGFHKCLSTNYFLPIKHDNNTYTFESIGPIFSDNTAPPLRPIDHTESGFLIQNEEHHVWTNTNPNGTSANTGHCGNWTSDSKEDFAGFGVLSSKDDHWTNNQDLTATCNQSLRIYCFEQCPSDPP